MCVGIVGIVGCPQVAFMKAAAASSGRFSGGPPMASAKLSKGSATCSALSTSTCQTIRIGTAIAKERSE